MRREQPAPAIVGPPASGPTQPENGGAPPEQALPRAGRSAIIGDRAVPAGPTAKLADMAIDLQAGLPTAAFVFRGYNVTNLGRSAELLAHRAYGSVVAEVLAEASAVASEEMATRSTWPAACGAARKRRSMSSGMRWP